MEMFLDFRTPTAPPHLPTLLLPNTPLPTPLPPHLASSFSATLSSPLSLLTYTSLAASRFSASLTLQVCVRESVCARVVCEREWERRRECMDVRGQLAARLLSPSLQMSLAGLSHVGQPRGCDWVRQSGTRG